MDSYELFLLEVLINVTWGNGASLMINGARTRALPRRSGAGSVPASHGSRGSSSFPLQAQPGRRNTWCRPCLRSPMQPMRSRSVHSRAAASSSSIQGGTVTPSLFYPTTAFYNQEATSLTVLLGFPAVFQDQDHRSWKTFPNLQPHLRSALRWTSCPIATTLKKLLWFIQEVSLVNISLLFYALLRPEDLDPQLLRDDCFLEKWTLGKIWPIDSSLTFGCDVCKEPVSPLR